MEAAEGRFCRLLRKVCFQADLKSNGKQGRTEHEREEKGIVCSISN